ncbi:hypothetical protein JIG36_04670 [Actinoplanes sp. LDG1-06]|uniref:Uncharacterized protein n=1 Tax=Paractinoplanes ovalisporus TaxID=2810368 RepID=A0ABS2A4S2_9ACTN|nr:hypothetical protein [Actinoplanes ovalisporus]MBM2614850.1 hypothetical protein [Actinoplanes ovalisporus]
MGSRHGDEACRDHVRRYLEAPFLADEGRLVLAGWVGVDDLFGEAVWPDIATAGVPPSLCRALEDWVTQESTPDEDVADFIGWPLPKVREHR